MNLRILVVTVFLIVGFESHAFQCPQTSARKKSITLDMSGSVVIISTDSQIKTNMVKIKKGSAQYKSILDELNPAYESLSDLFLSKDQGGFVIVETKKCELVVIYFLSSTSDVMFSPLLSIKTNEIKAFNLEENSEYKIIKNNLQ